MQQGFSGRTAIVTGASRGTGLAVAERLVTEGASRCCAIANAVGRPGSSKCDGLVSEQRGGEIAAERLAASSNREPRADLGQLVGEEVAHRRELARCL